MELAGGLSEFAEITIRAVWSGKTFAFEDVARYERSRA